MDAWWTVRRGAMTLEQTFSSYEEAELMAIAILIATGETWHAELAIGTYI